MQNLGNLTEEQRNEKRFIVDCSFISFNEVVKHIEEIRDYAFDVCDTQDNDEDVSYWFKKQYTDFK